jgi:hypothetical protein
LQAALDKSKAAEAETNQKITRLLSGGLSFTPDVETWEQALKLCKDDYVEARKQYPELFKAYRSGQKNSQK